MIVKLLNKNLLIIFVMLFALMSCNTQGEKRDKESDVLLGLLNRIAPNHQNNFVFKEIPTEDGKNIFEIVSKENKIEISGNNPTSMASGLNWYLRYYCHLRPTWDNFVVTLPTELPKVNQKIRKEDIVEYSYYLNYCTYNYSMSFWDWDRWEKEIDWMALNGINLPLAATGIEAVWQNTLKRLDYNDKEINDFIPGPAFGAWWLMGNLEGWGGPLPQNWINDHVALQKRILKRMHAYEMKPVVPAFFGMVPNSLKEKFPEADIKDQGFWVGGLKRPAFLNTTDPLFKKISKIFYEEQAKLFGTFEYFSGDPFHEGGKTKGIDLAIAGQDIFAAMKTISPNAKWVLQAWSGNPKKHLLDKLDAKNDVLILDLYANNYPQWEKRPDWGEAPVVWSIISNFGGNVGMFGRFDATVNEFNKALKDERIGNKIVGLGTLPEGIENNPVVYELLYEMKWHDKEINLNQWLNDYAFSRYGKKNPDLEKAWQILRNTAYSRIASRTYDYQGTYESIFCARPAMEVKNVSSWGPEENYYNPEEFIKALELFVKQADNFKDSKSFQYDLVDIARQVLANYGRVVYEKMIIAYKNNDKESFTTHSKAFLELIKDQNRLLNTTPEFMLGPWIESAKAWGNTIEEKKLYEYNARTLLTTWSFKDSSLHEYSHREWGGMLQSFYLPRWEMFVQNINKELNGVKSEPVDYYAFEDAWNKRTDTFPVSPIGNSIEIVKDLYYKHVKSIKREL